MIGRVTALAITSLALLAGSGQAAAAAVARASFPDIENDVMCVSCREPLAVAQSPQAYAERAYIRGLIAQGLSKPEIEQRLLAEYGPAVLGRPPAHGFNLTVYVLPPAILLLGLITLAITLPRWRRRSLAQTDRANVPPPLSPAETQRLDAELGRWPG